jgi:hypothetical protein
VARVGIVAAAVAAAVVPGGANAADWHLNGAITEEFEYDNNFRLDPDNEETLWGFNTRPQVGVEAHAPRTDLYMNGALNYGYFPEETDQNSFDQRGDVSLRHRTERSVFGFGGNVSHETTRTSEELDSGRDFSDAERIALGGNGSWSYTLTELVGVGVSAGSGYVTYDTDTLDDYRTFYGGPYVSFQLTEKDTLYLTGTYTRYDRLTGDNLESDLFVGNAVWTRLFTPQISASLRAGANYVSTDEDVTVGGTTVSTSDDNVGYDGGASITYTEERASLSGSFSHSIVPSSTGRLQRRNALGLHASYKATPLISFGFTTNFIQQESADDDDGSDERNYLNVEPGVTWHFLPNWYARAAYRFRTQVLDDEDRAYSNGGVASISWRLPSWSPGMGK